MRYDVLVHHVGKEYVSPGRTITEADIVAFAGLSGDYSTMHTDAEAGRSSIFGERVAHGVLGIAIASGLGLRTHPISELCIEAQLKIDWNFHAPITIGATVRCRSRLAALRERSGGSGAVAELEQILELSDSTVLQAGTKTLLLAAEPEAAT